ncbi:caspase recruitment domain-containing protein 19 [Kryptolebias marmoratus]|uniref:caspase recruitment domain-containing protein 19 n=1 Tax=Kryptolebias marmoratus TaxID=37003 RepID=UPI0018ACC89C|nr:caspase recruitment domain-containing protein 19 [Kryptolebias marmoratus]
MDTRTVPADNCPHFAGRDTGGYDEQLHIDAHFLCSHQRMDIELVDRLVLQLNRIYPQILSDKEACKFRKLSMLTGERLAELLKHLQVKGEDACYEFYRALRIHADRELKQKQKKTSNTVSKAVSELETRCEIVQK